MSTDIHKIEKATAASQEEINVLQFKFRNVTPSSV